MDRREYKKVDPLKYGKRRDTVVHILIDFFYSKYSHMLVQAERTRTAIVEWAKSNW